MLAMCAYATYCSTLKLCSKIEQSSLKLIHKPDFIRNS